MSEFMKTNEIKMKNCPKCGSPQESPELDGATARIWFTCGSYGYADEPEQLVYRSDKCLVREDINDLQRKVEELQVALDFANEAVDQRERSRKDAETELRNVKAAADYWHSKWKEACENARIKHKQVCELKRERNRLIDDLQASTIQQRLREMEDQRDEAVMELGAIQATIAEALNLPRTPLTAADVHAALNHLTQ